MLTTLYFVISLSYLTPFFKVEVTFKGSNIFNLQDGMFLSKGRSAIQVLKMSAVVHSSRWTKYCYTWSANSSV